MLFFRNRTGHCKGESSKSHHSLTPVTTVSSLGGRTLCTDTSKNSLRDRFKSLTGNFARRSIPGFGQKKESYTPNPWYPLKSEEDHDDVPGMVPIDAQHVEAPGKTWPAIKKSISSMASSLRSNRGRSDTSRFTGDALYQTLDYDYHLNKGFTDSQNNVQPWVTMETHVPPVALRHRTGYPGFQNSPEVVSTCGREPVPRLPSLAKPMNFLDSLSRTGLFRLFTPSLEVNNHKAAGITEQCMLYSEKELTYPPLLETIRVQSTTAAENKSLSGPIFIRRPVYPHYPHDDELYQKSPSNADDEPYKKSCGSSHIYSSHLSVVNKTETFPRTYQNRPEQHHPAIQEHVTTTPQKQQQTENSSRVPVEWLDHILETSYATRNSISTKSCISQATMSFLYQSNTCIFVDFPQQPGVPQPLRCYPGLKAALEDICDRFGQYYAPFAAYGASTRVVTLYAPDTPRPKDKFIDEDTALFDLHLARSAWVRPNVAPASSMSASSENTSLETSVDPAEASDHSQPGSEEDTDATDLGEDELSEPKTPENQKSPAVPQTPGAPKA
ncbi:hypothetical protein GGS21DRAFT_489106 [Xylaria nigripes]|nr:hypothetical protein GGS21DRAFT_489106 [Xylaria nigripes]